RSRPIAWRRPAGDWGHWIRDHRRSREAVHLGSGCFWRSLAKRTNPDLLGRPSTNHPDAESAVPLGDLSRRIRSRPPDGHRRRRRCRVADLAKRRTLARLLRRAARSPGSIALAGGHTRAEAESSEDRRWCAVKDKTTNDGPPRADANKPSSSHSGSKSFSHSGSKSKSQSQSQSKH